MSYYTPSMEEFHFGFEYEYNTSGSWSSFLQDSNEWRNVIFTCGGSCGETEFEDVKHLIEVKKLRVKYLDESDIISLGWLPVKHYDDEIRFQICGEFDYELTLQLESDRTFNVMIEDLMDIDGKTDIRTRFIGDIKNKSELSKIMKFLNIKLTNQ